MPLPSLLDPAATSPAAFGRNGPRALPPAAQRRYTVAADALGGTLAVQKQAQPNGEAGSLFSLMKVAEKIVEGKNHPAVRSWTTKLLDKHGNPKGAYARAKIILEALHPNGKSRWVPDPTGAEMIPGAHLILGDGDAPPYFALGDCDDLTTGWGAAVLVALMMLSAAESVGVRAAVVGHSYQKNGIIEHVLGALYDQGKWWYAEPSIPDMPFGEAKTPTREYVIEVPSLEVLCDAAVCLMPGGQASTAPPPPRRGDFLSVNGVTNPDPAEEAIGMNADNRALLDYADMTGICHATVTHARDVTLQEVLNQAQYAMWARAFVKTPDQPVLWHVPDFPVEQDRVAQSEIEVPWNDGIEPRTGANWTVPNSGFFPNNGDW